MMQIGAIESNRIKTGFPYSHIRYDINRAETIYTISLQG